VTRLALLDIVPTGTIYESLDQHRATTIWRYFFLTQPPELPERLIGADPGFYLDWTLREWIGKGAALDAVAIAQYERCFDAATIRDVLTLGAHASQLSGAGAHGGASAPQRIRSSSCSTEATSSLRSMNERPPPGSNDGTDPGSVPGGTW
jgi:hypothetical protein